MLSAAAGLEEDVVGEPAGRPQHDGDIPAGPRAGRGPAPPGIRLDQECFVEREIGGDARQVRSSTCVSCQLSVLKRWSYKSASGFDPRASSWRDGGRWH